MAGFSIRNPFFIIVCCLIVAIVGTVTLVRMPVDLFPPINIPVVVVATFYSGMVRVLRLSCARAACRRLFTVVTATPRNVAMS